MREPRKKDDTRLRLVEAGAEILRRQGYNGTGIQEVLDACGVPKGSFYHFFKSKEDFALQVVDHQAKRIASAVRRLFADTSHPPLWRLQRFFDSFLTRYGDPANAFSCCGCPIGNLVQEMAPVSTAFRLRLEGVIVDMEAALGDLLREAQAQGEMSRRLDPDEAARFIAASWQGAILRMKAAGDCSPLTRARAFLMQMVTAP